MRQRVPLMLYSSRARYAEAELELERWQLVDLEFERLDRMKVALLEQAFPTIIVRGAG
jgi:hypothetical protein